MNFHKYLTYNPETGLLRFKVDRVYKKAGDITGCDNGHGYIQVYLNGRYYKGHRIAWEMTYGEIPEGYEIDHINHIRSDNRLCNLRLVSKSENQRNLSKYKNNTSGVTGVSWDKSKNKWVAQIHVNRKHINLGRFDNPLDAAAARKRAEIKYGFHDSHGADPVLQERAGFEVAKDNEPYKYTGNME